MGEVEGTRFNSLLQELAKEYVDKTQNLQLEIVSLQCALRDLQASTKDVEDSNNARSTGVDLEDLTIALNVKGAKEEKRPRDGAYSLKGTWIKLPEASGPWSVNTELDEVDENARCMMQSSQLSRLSSSGLKKKLEERSAISRCIDNWLPTIDPTNPIHLTWDVTGMVFVIWDMITIPMFLSFEMDDSQVAEVMGWITLIFWTMDMVLSVFTGYYEDGQLVMSHRRILKKYLKGWFWIDCIVVVPDWVMKAMGSVTNVAGLGRILRTARIMRTARTLRVLKLKSIFNMVYDWVDSEYSFIWMNIMKLVLMVLFLNHIVACFWYLIGRLSKEHGAAKNWLEDDGKTRAWGTSLGWRYLTSLHWSITQFTPASMDISATNISERLFSIAILFFGLVALSSIIGSVSASMTALRNMSSDETKNLWMLRRFLVHKKTPRKLSRRIIEYVEYQQIRKHHLNQVEPEKVKLLGSLSEQLQLELAYEIYSPYLTQHHFFRYLAMDMNVMMLRMSRYALKEIACASDDSAFQAGDHAEFMFIVKDGAFQYMMANGKALETPLCKKAWASEAPLWTEWRHRGHLIALEPSSCIAVVATKMADILRHHLRSWHMAAAYGHYFVQYLNSYDRNSLTDVIFSGENWLEVMKQCDNYSSDKHLRDIDRSASQRSPELHKSTSMKVPDNPSEEGGKDATVESSTVENSKVQDSTVETHV